VSYLREVKLWGGDDPLFPKTRIAVGETHQFEVTGLERNHWSNATPIRTIFREAFDRAGVPYFNPHSFRNTLAKLGEDVCKSPEEFKAWSQNIGHEKVLTTLTSYGEVACHRQGEIIRGLAAPKQAVQSDVKQLAEELLRQIRDSSVNRSAPPPFLPGNAASEDL
jgi:integrase